MSSTTKIHTLICIIFSLFIGIGIAGDSGDFWKVLYTEGWIGLALTTFIWIIHCIEKE